MKLKRFSWVASLVLSGLAMFLLITAGAAQGDDKAKLRQLKEMKRQQEREAKDPTRNIESDASIKQSINASRERANQKKTELETERDALTQKGKKLSEDEEERLEEVNKYIEQQNERLHQLDREEKSRLNNAATFRSHRRAIKEYLDIYGDYCKGAREMIKKAHWRWVETYLKNQEALNQMRRGETGTFTEEEIDAQERRDNEGLRRMDQELERELERLCTEEDDDKYGMAPGYGAYAEGYLAYAG